MDNSQSSDVFSDTSFSCNSSREIMDVLTYDSLLHKTKASLGNIKHVGNVSFPSHFTAVLEDCRQCIAQSLDLVVNILLDSDVPLEKLSQYIEDAVSLLRLLSNFVKVVVESMSMSCCMFKTFPTTTGHIIAMVFTHCKNSESVYGDHLSDVQKQLKDLFRMCHELQLTYLMVLEKHFIFDLTMGEQLDILIEALNINLQIGEVVQSLDVKTMAEQWKAYMALCEKYSAHLMDKSTYYECTQLLCAMVKNSLGNATEVDQEEKVVVRSLKVTNFTLKILLKICIIFKHASVRDHASVVDLLIYIHLHNAAYLEWVEGRPTQFVNAVTTNVVNPSDLLLRELIIDEKFMNMVLSKTMDELREEKLLGYVFLIVDIMKCTLENNDPTPNNLQHKLLHCIFKVLPLCHVWLNIGMRFKSDQFQSEKSVGLFEYLLIYATGLALTMNAEEMCHLEKIMYEALLGTEEITALFSSNLWTALARMINNRQLLLSQVVPMCHIYKKLDTNKAFSRSPQRLHICLTMNALFEAMRVEDRVKVFKNFNPLEDQKNISLWSILEIKNLPKDMQRHVEEDIMERYRSISESTYQDEESIHESIQLMNLFSTCLLSSSTSACVCAWLRACPRTRALSNKCTSPRYYDYVEALVAWTRAVGRELCDNSANLVKVLHVISSILKADSIELKLLFTDLLCELATTPIQDDNKHSVADLVKESFKNIMQDNNNIVKKKLFSVVISSDNKRLEQIICSINAECQEAWNYYKLSGISNDPNITKLKAALMRTSGFKYVHKCIETQEFDLNSESVDLIQKTASSNFDFADLDTLFDNESDSEPANKKLKLDSSETETILGRLENDALLLCNLKENIFTSEHKRRIQGVCEKLKDLVT